MNQLLKVFLPVSLGIAVWGTLAAEQADPAFEPLFNGVNLVGWTVSQGHALDWAVEDGEMIVRRRSQGGARELRTAREYRDFELSLDFKVAEGGNSGVFIRMGEGDAGLEIQLLDDYAPKHANLKEWQYTGALYGLAGPSSRQSKPAGEWQTMTVRLENQELVVTLNGETIIETDLDQFTGPEVEERWQAALQRETGYLGLQNYGTETRFRNVSIRVLGEE